MSSYRESKILSNQNSVESIKHNIKEIKNIVPEKIEPFINLMGSAYE